MFVIGVCECCPRPRARRSFILLAMLPPPSPDDCVEDCASGSSAKGDTTGVGAMLGCSLLDCDGGLGYHVNPGGYHYYSWGMPGSSLLECSSPENCGPASDSESELSRARVWECLIKGAMLTASVA